jgi:hypothetical protein
MNSNSKYLGVEPYIYFRFSVPGVENDLFIKDRYPLKFNDCSWIDFEKVEDRPNWSMLSRDARQKLKKTESIILDYWKADEKERESLKLVYKPILCVKDYRKLIFGELVAKGEIVEILANDNNWIRVQFRFSDTVFYCRRIIYRGRTPYAIETRTELPFVVNSRPALHVGNREIYCLGHSVFDLSPEVGLIEIERDAVQYRNQWREPVLKECFIDFYRGGKVRIHGEKTTEIEKNYRGEDWTYVKGYSAEGWAYIKNRAEYEFYKQAYCDFAQEHGCDIDEEDGYTRISFTFSLLDELNEKYKDDIRFRVIGTELKEINEKY